MIEFIVKYWLEFLFGLIIALFAFFRKTLKKMFQDYVQKQCQTEVEKTSQSIVSSLEELREENKQQNKEIQEIHNGILSLQGISFRAYCKRLLEEDHEITLEEFENCQDEYQTYHGLGGNGKGTALFNLVCEKAKYLAK